MTRSCLPWVVVGDPELGDVQEPAPVPKLSSPVKRVFLSLGSNLGDRVANIRKALEQLAEVGVAITRVSSLYKTEPMDFRPQAWFVNCVAEAETRLMPMQLLTCGEDGGTRPGPPHRRGETAAGD